MCEHSVDNEWAVRVSNQRSRHAQDIIALCKHMSSLRHVSRSLVHALFVMRRPIKSCSCITTPSEVDLASHHRLSFHSNRLPVLHCTSTPQRHSPDDGRQRYNCWVGTVSFFLVTTLTTPPPAAFQGLVTVYYVPSLVFLAQCPTWRGGVIECGLTKKKEKERIESWNSCHTKTSASS